MSIQGKKTPKETAAEGGAEKRIILSFSGVSSEPNLQRLCAAVRFVTIKYSRAAAATEYGHPGRIPQKNEPG